MLAEPEGHCADYYYKKLIGEESIQALHSLMQRNFAAALMDEAQQALNAYLSTDSKEINTRVYYRNNRVNSTDIKYSKYPLQLAKAAELLGSVHYMYKTLLAKQYFFEGENKYYLGINSEQKDSLWNAALADYELALSYEPNSAHVYLSMGRVYSWKENYDKALHCINESLRYSPSWALAWMWLGRAYRGLGQYEKAESAFNKAAELKPDYLQPYLNLKDFYWELKNYEKSIETYERLMDIDSTISVWAYWNLAWVFYSTKRKEEAYRLLNKGIGLFERAGGKGELFYLRGLLEYYEGKVEESLLSFYKAREMQISNLSLSPSFILAIEKVVEKDVSGAILSFEEAVKEQPDSDNPKYILCQLKIGQGDFDEALELLQQALEIGGRTYDFMANDPKLAPIREMPRYKELMRKHFPGKQ